MTTWIRISGLVVSAIALYWLRVRNIPVAWEGEAPLYYIRGRAAVIVACVTLLVGLLLFLGVFDRLFGT